MASRIITKKGSGAPLASDLVHGELAVDTVNKRLYTENAGGTVIEVGTAPSTIDINAGTIDGTVIGGSTAAAITGTTITGTSFVSSGDMTFGDNDKAVFGAGSDLQIYHDGGNSRIVDSGTGILTIQASSQLGIYNSDATQVSAEFVNDGKVGLRYSGSEKLATTATGIDVTGTVTADGLTVDGTGVQANLLSTNASENYLYMKNTEGSAYIGQNAGVLQFWSGGNTGGVGAEVALKIDGNNDISFYEDTGTTPKFFWDASAERLGLGTSSPSRQLSIYGTDDGYMSFNGGRAGNHEFVVGTDSVGFVIYDETLDTYRLVIDQDSGNVGIGTSSVGAKLHVLSGTDNNIAANVSEVRFIGADKAITGEQANLVIQTNDDMAVNKGGSIGLGGRHTTSSTNGGNFAQISGRKENATSANFAGYLAFGTSDSASDIHERMRIDSSGHLIVPNGITLGTAVGTYAAANTLDDYEEGTFTPYLESNGQVGSFTHTTQTGYYTKIGRVVNIILRISWSAIPTTGSTFRVAGLPFVYSSATDANAASVSIGSSSGVPNTDGLYGFLGTTGGGSRSAIVFYSDGATAINVTTGNNISASGTIRLSLTYIV